MSAKLLYSLSDNKSNQQKQLGCMNGFLQFFDPHNFIGSPRANNINRRILPPDENMHQGGANSTSKKPKGKHLKTIKTKEISSESSRISVSSSASTIMSSTDCERSVKKESYRFSEGLSTDKYLIECRVNQPYSSCPSPIQTAKRQQVVSHGKKLDSTRLLAHSESFRSASSNQSAPILGLRRNPDQTVKDSPRFSYDGRETKDLPRLSLDSRQRTTREYVRESKDDLVLRHSRREKQNHRNGLNLPQEPASCRAPANIVAKLMGLEALPDCSPSIKNEIEQDEASICGSSDFPLRSSQIINVSTVKGGLYSPRNNSSESITSRERKNKLPAPTNQELSLEPHKHALTMYGKIEERMNDLDFKRSGKDLRALKQVLESIHREKNKEMPRNEHWSSKDAKLRDTKPGKLATDYKKEVATDIQDLPLKTLHQISIGKPRNGNKDAAQKRTTKNTTKVHDPSHRTLSTTHNSLGKRSPKQKATTKGQPMTNDNVPSPVKNSKKDSSSICSYTIVRTLDSKTKQHKADAKGLRSQSERVGRKSYILKGKDDISKVISTDSTFLTHEKRAHACFSKDINEVVSEMHRVLKSTDQVGTKYNAWQLAADDKIAAEASCDSSLDELAIEVREQPSPVSVLDTDFSGDESTAPVKKNPTAFRDYEVNATDTIPEWRDIDITFPTPHNLTPCFRHEKEDKEVNNFSQIVQPLRQLDRSPGRNTYFVESQEGLSLQKEYVTELLATSGFLDDTSFNVINLQVEQSQKAINPKIFHLLEQTEGNKYLSEDRSTSRQETILGINKGHQRKLLFDTVNEILTAKLSFTRLGIQPRTTGRELLQEILTEIDQLQASSLHQSLDDEDGFLTAIIQKDLGNWTNVSSEVPGLILDIERLIFKDLIAELIN